MKNLGRSFILLAMPFMFMSSVLSAQTSQVSGQIRDTSGAAVAGATVSLIRTENGDHREQTSSANGYYSFTPILPGHYDLTVRKDSFAEQIQKGILVETGIISTVDVTLGIGKDVQTVDVSDTLALLQSESSSVASVVENASIENLPLIDRRASQLQRLNGFVVQNGSGSSSSFAVAGGRGNNADYTVDGGTVQNLLIGVPILIFDPPAESVQEFNLASSTYSSELGRSGGAVVQMTTKSGTNAFHGSAYEYLRNTAFQAQPEFSTTVPTLHYNLFGVSLGGPIKKDKTQFFFNYEGRRNTWGIPQQLVVPNPQILTGNFNGIIDPKTGQQVAVFNPTTGAQFTNNQIPASLLDSVGAKLAAFYPTNVTVVPGSPTGLLVANDPQTYGSDAYVGRVDHIFGQKDRMFGRFLIQTDHTVQGSVFPTPGTDPLGALVHDYSYNVSGTWYHNFSANAVNEASLTYTRRQYLYYSGGANTTLDSQIGLNTFDQSFFPTVNVAGLEGLGSTGQVQNALQVNAGQQERLQSPVNSNAYIDKVSWIRGKHQFKFGGEWRTSNNTDKYRPFGGGTFTFNNDGASTNTAVGSITNLLMGNVYTATINEFYTIHTVANSWGAFVQDDWKVTPRLTLNLGLRWDLDAPRKTNPNAQNLFNPTAINPVSGTLGVVTFSGIGGTSVYAHNWDYNNFGPRIGFAWQPLDKWVVRGGGGVLYTGEYDSATPLVANLGYGTTGTSSAAVYAPPAQGATNDGIFAPSFQLSTIGTSTVFWTSPTAANLTPGFGAVAAGTNDYRSAHTVVSYFQPNHVNGYLYQASFDVEREIAGNMLVSVSYLGTFGHSLPVTENAGGLYSINQVPDSSLPLINPALGGNPALAQSLRPFPQFANVYLLDPNIGQSKYNGANVGIQKRYTRGFQLQANYTFSKFMDNADARNELAGFPGDNSFTDYYNPKSRWGLSGNDVRHRIVLSTVYELPVGTGKRFGIDSNLLDEIVGGWSVGTIAELHTGTPLSVIDAVNQTGSFSDGVRPNLVGNPVLSSGQRSSTEWFNTAAFQANAPFTFGDAPRTFGSGPGTAQVDASLLKTFHVYESTNLQFRAEALNVLNHPNWANPSMTFGSPTFGKVTGLQSGNQSRIIQLALHLTF